MSNPPRRQQQDEARGLEGAARTDAHPLASLVTEKNLRALAGEKSYDRGESYFSSGAVQSLIDSGDAVAARVTGTDEYKVTLKAEGGKLHYHCSCPFGEEGEFCKHAVATGLAWLDQQIGGETLPDYTGRGELAAIRAHLAGLDRDALVELLMQQVAEDDALRAGLGAQVARRNAAADPGALKAAVRKALAVSDFVDYRGMRALIQRAGTVADLLRGLIADGKMTLAAELATYAMQRGIAAYERSDDSGGSFGELLHEIAALHLETCRKTQPLSEASAKSFFELKCRDEWGFFEWKDYAQLFGEAGRAAYRALAEKDWAKVPARAPAHAPNGDGGFDSGNFRITRIMEELAREAGDIDGLVAVKSRNLSSAYAFLVIAEILAGAGRSDEALAWAERGLAAFRARPDGRLIEFLVEEYARRKRFEDGVHIAWENFLAHPGRRSYPLLKRAAAGAQAAAAWRDKAIAWAQENRIEDKSRARPAWLPGGHALLVEIHLEEGDSDAALAEARAGGCTESLWFEIAHEREKNHPADAAEIYRKSIDRIVGQAKNSAYDQGVALIAKVRKLMRSAGQEREFVEWLGELRVRHKAKRNFLQRLEAALGKAQ